MEPGILGVRNVAEHYWRTTASQQESDKVSAKDTSRLLSVVRASEGTEISTTCTVLLVA